MQKAGFMKFLVRSGLVALLCTSFQVYSQQESKTDQGIQAQVSEENDDDITVSATRTRRQVSTTPGEVSVVTKEELREVQPADLQDIVRYEPNVEVTNQTRGVGQKPIIRGLSGSRVLVNVDETRITFDSGHKGQLFLEPAWLKRAEVIRGPGSALYGSNALGGVLSLETLDPADLIAPDGTFGLAQSIGFQGINDQLSSVTTFAGRVGESFEYLVGYGLRDAHTNYDIGGDTAIPFSEEDSDSFLVKAVWWATDYDRFELSMQRYTLTGDTPTNTAETGTSGLVDRMTMQDQFRLQYEHENPDNPWVDLAITAYYNDLHIEEDKIAESQHDRIDFSTLGLNVRNTSRFSFGSDHSMDLTYGFEFFRDEQDASRDNDPSSFFPEAQADNTAFFAQAELAFWGDLLTIIPGIRYDIYDLEAPGKEGVKEREVSLKLGAALKLDDEINLNADDYVVFHASYGEGFRAPTFGELFISGEHFTIPFLGTAYFIPNPELKPETSYTIEGGVRTKFGRLKTNATWYHTEAEDFISTVHVSGMYPVGDWQAQNISHARLYGIELGFEYELSDSITLWGNYSQGKGDDLDAGEPLSGIAPESLKLGIDWASETCGLRAGLRTRIYADQDRVPSDAEPADGYQLYDFVSSWSPTGDNIPEFAKGFSVQFAVENLTDEEFTWFTGSPGHGINPSVTLSYSTSW